MTRVHSVARDARTDGRARPSRRGEHGDPVLIERQLDVWVANLTRAQGFGRAARSGWRVVRDARAFAGPGRVAVVELEKDGTRRTFVMGPCECYRYGA